MNLSFAGLPNPEVNRNENANSDVTYSICVTIFLNVRYVQYASKEINAAGAEYTKNLEEIRNRECSTKAAEKLNRLRRHNSRQHRSTLVPADSHESPLDFSELLRWFEAVNAGNITIEVLYSVQNESPKMSVGWGRGM